MQPTGHGIGLADRAGLAEQHQKRGLECVVGVVRVAEDLPANTEAPWVHDAPPTP